jgi:NAD(P)-dependent dehydrogenase (short-subunit alcohol dehydrogenase family)
MKLAGRTVVITGAAGGIGAALARRFAAEGVAALVLADLNGDAVAAVAESLSGSPGGTEVVGVPVDVTDEGEVAVLVDEAVSRFGQLDLFCSNAGILTGEGVEAGDDTWQRTWAVNVLAHVYAARAALPPMLARGEGYLLQTCSAAGLLTAVGDAPYTVTKHAAVGFAEWLAVTYGDRGIKVSALCPQGVDTPMLRDGLAAGHPGALITAGSGAVLTPEQIAEATVEGLAAERFLILPHPEVATYLRHKVDDPDRWLAGLRRAVRGLDGATPDS